MDDRKLMDFAVVTYRRENIAFERGRSVEDLQRLVRIAGENHLVKRLPHTVFVLDHDAGRLPIHLCNRPVEVDLVAKVGRQVLVDAPRSLVPRLHGSSLFDIEEFEIPREERCWQIEHIRCQHEIDEHGFQDLVPEVRGKSSQIQDRPHADVIERVEGVQQLGLGTAQPTKPMQTPQNSLELGNLGL